MSYVYSTGSPDEFVSGVAMMFREVPSDGTNNVSVRRNGRAFQAGMGAAKASSKARALELVRDIGEVYEVQIHTEEEAAVLMDSLYKVKTQQSPYAQYVSLVGLKSMYPQMIAESFVALVYKDGKRLKAQEWLALMDATPEQFRDELIAARNARKAARADRNVA